MASYHHGEQAPNPVFCYASLSLSPELRFAFSVTAAAAAGVAVSPSSTTRVFVLFYSGNCKKRKFIFQKKIKLLKKTILHTIGLFY